MNKKNNIDYTILFRYFEQNATPEEIQKIRVWEQNPDTMQEIEEAYHLWGNLNKETLVLKDEELKVLFDKHTKKYKSHLLRKSFIYYWIIILCLLSTLFIFNHAQKHQQQDLYILKTMNNKLGNTEVWLSDSTHVILSKGSTLKLWELQSNKNFRAVQLRGKAFFDVAKNKQKPFLIETGSDMVVKVLGTSFVLHTDESSNFDLGLISGRVELLENDKLTNTNKAGILITPGQMVRYSSPLNQITIDSFFNVSVALNWTNPKLDLRAVSLGNVLANLSDWYKVTMECNKTLQEKYTCTIQISDETLSQTLDILSAMLPQLKITQHGDIIKIEEK